MQGLSLVTEYFNTEVLLPLLPLMVPRQKTGSVSPGPIRRISLQSLAEESHWGAPEGSRSSETSAAHGLLTSVPVNHVTSCLHYRNRRL